MFHDEASYLREWIEFHRLVGVERFFLYDHESVDDSREVLAPTSRTARSSFITGLFILGNSRRSTTA